ncbi:putative ribonuclease H-like domain-containing protein [Tanacetum coccineum]|uniref:Ribonuclease H-like domain-containing protein n=1 Tax=Tanacetum coccineum TaxID=301880 RepID=A0ABQ5JDX9_9ASTR
MWQVIMNGDEPIQITKDENGVETEVPLKTTQALLQRQKERKAKSILLLAIPDEYQLRFYTIKDAKSLWAAIKSIFSGNVKSKKMQKNVLKQQFENFSVFDTKGLDKAYDRFQKLISQLEIHGAAVSNKDANQKFLRALPSSWNNITLIMRNKEGIDEIDIDDLYNNLKVFEADIKGSFGSSLKSQNVAFLYVEDTNSINEVNNANGVSTATCHSSQGQSSSLSYTNDLMFPFFVDQNGDAWYRSRDNTRRTVPVKTSDALVVLDNALIVQDGFWSYIAQDEPTEFALMAYTSNSLGSDTEAKGSSDSGLFNSVFDSRSSDGDDNQTNDRFKKDNEYHAVPPPLTGNYIPPLADLSFAGLDDSVYRPTTNKTSASVSQVETSNTPPSNTSVEMPRVESVRPSGVIIEDWVSDDEEDIFQSEDSQTTVKPSFKKIEFTKARNETVKTDKQAVKPRMVTQSPKVDRKDWNGKMTQKLGLEECPKASILRKGTSHKEVRPIWNNTQRINHQNKFVPTAVLTRSGRIPVSTAKQNVNTVLNTRVSKEKVNTVRVNGVNTVGQTTVSTVKGNGVTAVKALADIDGGFVAFGRSTKGGKITSIEAIIDESKLWHRRLGHVNFKIMNKLVKGNLVRGLPSKTFENDHTCVACQKGKQHKASYKTKLMSSISQPLQMLHMDLFGPTSVRSINHKTYCLVVTDDFSRDKKEYSVARTPQQNGVAERKNSTLIEAARTMLVDSLLPTVF